VPLLLNPMIILRGLVVPLPSQPWFADGQKGPAPPQLTF